MVGSPGGPRPPFSDHPPTDPATHETSGGVGARGHKTIRGRESDAPDLTGGRLIPHAGAIGALMVAMIQAPFRTALVPAVGGPDRDPPRRVAARRRAVRLPSITPRTDRKELATTTTGLLAKRGIHGVGVRRRRSDWTPSRNRGTTVWTGSNGRNSRRSRGSGGRVRALLSIVLRRLP